MPRLETTTSQFILGFTVYTFCVFFFAEDESIIEDVESMRGYFRNPYLDGARQVGLLSLRPQVPPLPVACLQHFDLAILVAMLAGNIAEKQRFLA